MTYVVKVGEYYVKAIITWGYIELSNEIMRGFDKELAERIAKKLNGEVIEIQDQVTMCDEVDNG